MEFEAIIEYFPDLEDKLVGRENKLSLAISDDRNVFNDSFEYFSQSIPFGSSIIVTFEDIGDASKITSFKLKLFKGSKYKWPLLDRLEIMFDDGRNKLPDMYYYFSDDIPWGSKVRFNIKEI